MTKDELRREMRRRLRTLDAREEKSRAITEAVAAHPAFVRSGRVALFAPLPSEPDIEGLWEKGAREFCYPRIIDETIEFVDEANNYKTGHFALQQHDPGSKVCFKKIEVKELPADGK